MRTQRSCWWLILGALVILVFSPSLAAKEVLTLWTAFPEVGASYEKIAAEYMNLHPNVDIRVEIFASRAMDDKLAVSLPAGVAADILDQNPVHMAPYVNAGLIERPPTELQEFYVDTTYEFLQPGGLIDGEVWGVPVFCGLKYLFYNKSMFKEVGLARPPETLEELMKYAFLLAKYNEQGRLVRSGLSLRLSGGGYGVTEKFWVLALAPYGGAPVIETAPGKYRNGFDTEAGRKALQFYIDALYKYEVESYAIENDTVAFSQEVTAMYERESQVISFMAENAPAVDYGMAPIPGDVYHGTLAITESLFVPSVSANKALAWDFIKFITNEENTRSRFLETGWNPVRGDIDYTPVFDANPALDGLVDFPEGYGAYSYPAIVPATEIWTKAGEWLTEQFTRKELVDNPEGIAAACTKMGSIVDDILKEYDIYDLGE